MNDVQILDDPIGFIRKRPGMFVRSQPVSGAELAANIVGDALLLTSGHVTAFRKAAWWVIASDIDWIASQSSPSVEDYFSRIVPLPQAGPNSMRGEVLLVAFARDVVSQGEDGRHVVTGDISMHDEVWDILNSDPKWKRVIAFRLEMA
jgi:hypothetical protein